MNCIELLFMAWNTLPPFESLLTMKLLHAYRFNHTLFLLTLVPRPCPALFVPSPLPRHTPASKRCDWASLVSVQKNKPLLYWLVFGQYFVFKVIK